MKFRCYHDRGEKRAGEEPSLLIVTASYATKLPGTVTCWQFSGKLTFFLLKVNKFLFLEEVTSNLSSFLGCFVMSSLGVIFRKPMLLLFVVQLF